MRGYPTIGETRWVGLRICYDEWADRYDGVSCVHGEELSEERQGLEDRLREGRTAHRVWLRLEAAESSLHAGVTSRAEFSVGTGIKTKHTTSVSCTYFRQGVLANGKLVSNLLATKYESKILVMNEENRRQYDKIM